MVLKIDKRKNLISNFLSIYGLNSFKILKILHLLGFSWKTSLLKIDSNLKVILSKIIKQNYFYSKDVLKRRTKLKINYLKKIKSFRGYNLH